MIKIFYFLLSAGLFAGDYFSKIWALHGLGQPIKILPVLELRLAFNYGAAFSFLANHDGWQRWFFIGIGIVVCIYLIYAILITNSSSVFALLGMSSILGGAIGNIVDRYIRGYVVDFLHVNYQTWSFPIFNLADCFITVGVGFMMLDWIFNSKKAK